MTLKRVLTFFNIAVAALLAIALTGVYWYAWRPLPKTSGRIEAPLAQAATAIRDSLGKPHIRAGGLEDVLFLQGFVTAQDRLWQMDSLRRVAAGRLSEIVGQAGIAADREARRLRLERVADEHYRALPPDQQAAFRAFARGVNRFIDSHRGRLPLEFALLGYDPRPWRPADSVLIGLYMHRTLTTTWDDEVQKRKLLTGGDAAKVNLLFAVRTGGEIQPGSNAWVLGGSRTASGRPILANDPHMEYSLPAVWYMVHLQAPGLNVSGVSFPGIPGVIIGHNDRVAWGVTNLQFDVQDLYVEKFDVQTGRYLFKGQPEQARLERDVIRVKGGNPIEVAQWVTRHGPILVTEGGQALALRWTAADPGSFRFPFLDINRARNWQEFRAALSRFPGPAQNFVYADVDGNIGYQVAGDLPVRRNYDGDVPVDGASGAYEWDGYIPFEQLPSSYNPPSGLIVTANQNPFPEDYPYRVNGNFASRYRTSEIVRLLSARKGWRPEEMITVQKDVYSPFSHMLARQIVAAYERKGATNAGLSEAIAILRDWNGQMEKGSPAALLATLAYQHLRKAVTERASPGNGLNAAAMAPAAVEKLLRERPADWFCDYDQLLVRAFVDAVEEGRRIQGDQVSAWDYGRYNELTLAHPIVSRIPLVGKYFNIGPMPQSGSGTTIKQTTRRLGPSMRMAVDLSDLDRSYQGILTGQSGHALSRHYKDQWERYYSGRTFPMPFRSVEARDTLVFEPLK